MQQVVLNRAALELQQQAAEEEEADIKMAADEETEAADQEQAEAPWVPRVVVLGAASQPVSTAERAGQVVVVRPSHLKAAVPAHVPASTPGVVVVPRSAHKKTPAASVAKRACTPARTAAKACTPAQANSLAAAPASAVRSAARDGCLPELPRSMLKEAPGERR
jgi:hypothetical protein